MRKSAVAPLDCPLVRARVLNILTAGTNAGTIIATIMTVHVAMNAPRPMDVDIAPGMPI
jgi:hypothetical protein